MHDGLSSREKPVLDAKALAKIDLPNPAMLNHLIRRAFHQHGAIMNDVGTVNNIKRFANIMVGNQNADTMCFQMCNQIANFAKRNRVNAGRH